MTAPVFNPDPDCEIVSSRIFNHPTALVFRAWAEPEHLQKWWGPAGFTNTFHRFEFLEGGRWQFTMHGPDKGHYQNECEFIRIEPPHLIYWKRHSKPLFHVLAVFEETSPSSTRLVFKMLFDTAAECGKIKPYAIEKNEENFDRLEMELSLMSGKSQEQQ